MSSSEKGMYTAYLEGSLKLSRTGEWWHNGSPFQNQRLADFFSQHIVWDASAKRYFVQIGAQRATFDCEDTAYFVLHIDESAIPWKLTLSDGTTESFEPDTLVRGKEDQLYCTVHGQHRARLSRAAHQILLRHASSELELTIAGKRYTLGTLD